ncbi:heme lyase CcmF/NrfE family subunit [Falsiroseomonas stagni]|uniref:Cytochrome c-type biogenesis protein CcmF n=1 Tax=Falsiroseomonas stagni DSM 19981 TaxID=1123062 RepID=A0A1I4A819_9PROT|nr:heme lyase CcmF/NrfE family subunit [Falsiroseomonas stagni]SFK52227.1 cytochrome c-type biogenesis protein CcmF [Falsiroseomonas stagni DSM 19981]
MIAELGHFALALALVLALAQALLPLIGAHVRDGRMMASAAPLAVGQCLALIASFACLVYVYVINDTTVLNVVQNSHSLKPLLYKITGTWGNHEGSLLLWVNILGLCGAAVSGFGRELPTALRARVLGVLGLISVGFLMFTIKTSNPFDRMWPPPPDGQGLNPVLQDIGLAMHPPLLYVGYVGYAVTFAFAIAALIEGRVDAAWGRWVRPWSLAAWSFLTLGIALGSWWAYYELGWGGYWFWDPVENASLLPWLIGTALLHSAIVVEKRDALKTWTILLAIIAFAMSLLGTFLVRSGVLNSVHSFANDPERGLFILALLMVYVIGAFLLFAFRASAMIPTGIFAPVSREGAIVLNNLLVCSITAVVFVGTLWPMFADALFGMKVSVGPPFFNAASFPLVVPLLLAMAAGPLMPWKRAQLFSVVMRLWWCAVIGFAAFFLALLLSGQKVMPAVGFAFAAWVVGAAIADIADRTALFRTNLGNSWNRAKGLPRAAWGAAIAHAGVGICAAGIAGMGLAQERMVALAPGESTTLAGYEWRLEGVRDVEGPNWTARRATISLLKDGAVVHVMEPSRRWFPIARQNTTEVAIRTNLIADLYAVIGEEEAGTGKAVIRLHYNLLAPWIWLGAAIMALGGGLSLADRRIRVSAPNRATARMVPAE